MSAAATSSTANNIYSSTTATAAEEAAKATRAQLTTNDFVTLLLAELASQDPLTPMDTSDMMNQLVQIQNIQASTSQTDALSTMTQTMESITTHLAEMTFQSQFQAACSLIGREVSGTNASGAVLTGTVNNVTYSDKVITLSLDSGEALPYANLEKVTS